MTKRSKIYGKEIVLDLKECHPTIIRTEEKISEYVDKICSLIKMKKHGKIILDRFGEGGSWGKGYSFFQFIEESSISGHFLEINNSAYINIFSCKTFNEKVATSFTKKFFKAKKIKNRVLIR